MTIERNFTPLDRRSIDQLALRCEPLLARMDPLLTGSIGQFGIDCTIHCSNGAGEFSLTYPFFTRMSAEGGLSLNLKRLLLAELERFGVAWLGELPETCFGTFGESNQIFPLQLDEPINVQLLQSANAIEVQMFGLPFQTLPNSRRRRWTPGLPIEISDFEQLAKKIDLLRVLSGGKCPIGVAVSPGSVYEDLRFMLDCGVDFITLLCEVQYGMSTSSCLSFAPLEPTLEQSVKAVQDSGSSAKLLVSSNLVDGNQMHRCLQLGASAVSIDAFLALSKPNEVVPAKETFGSVLSAYVPASAGSIYAWVGPAMERLIEELKDSAVYAGRVATPLP